MSSRDSNVVALRRPAGSSARRASLPPFDELLRENFDALFRTARHLAGADAEDVVQEAAVRAVRSYGGVRDGAAARAWLFRVLRNTALNVLRDRRRHVAEIVDVPVEAVLDEASAAIDETTEPAAVIDQRRALERAFARVEAAFREVVWLVDGEGFTIVEVVDILELPQGTVASRLYRGRRRLRALLRAEPEPDGTG